MTKPKPIGIGLVGLGRAGWGMHCEEIKGKEEMFRIAAVCDPIPERRRAAQERYGCPAYETLEALLDDGGVELVDITTRSSDHCKHGVAALAAGKHVFMEKPLALDYDEALRLKAAAEASAGDLFVRHNRRFDPDFLHVRDIAESGMLGDVYEVKLRRHGYDRRDDWQTIKQFGGGQLLNWGPHIVDHALRLLGAPVEAMWSDLKRVAAVGDAEDHVKIVLRGANGRVVDLEISGGVALSSPLYTVYGTRGSLQATHKEISLRYLDPEVPLADKAADGGTPGAGASFGSRETLRWKEETFPVAPAKRYDIWEELYRAIREGAEFPIALEEAVEVMRMISEAKRGTAF
jgi:predicted dehydrogenase